jgi:hypothetical protein
MPHMPTHEYFCEANGPTIAVSHRLSALPGSWGELCQRSGAGLARSPIQCPKAANRAARDVLVARSLWLVGLIGR